METFLSCHELKHVVITHLSWLTDRLAQYAQHTANGYEFELTLNTGKVTLLHRTKLLNLLPKEAEHE